MSVGTAIACSGASDAVGPAGRPALVTKYGDTDHQIAVAGTAVALPPSVLVVDQRGGPVAGVSVTWEVTVGEGTVAAASDAAGAKTATVVTNDHGLATVANWTLGATIGQNHLKASIGSSVAPADFVATGADVCRFAATFTSGTPVSGILTNKDCDDDNYFYDYHRTTVVTGGAVLISLNSTAFDPYLQLFDEAGRFIAINDNRVGYNAGIKALLKTNTYIIGVSSSDLHGTGPYTLTVQPTNSSIEGCDVVWVSVTINTVQTIASTDCNDASRSYYSDRMAIILKRGQTVTITMSSTAVDAFLALSEVTGDLVALDDNSNGGTNARIVYTSPAVGAYFIDAGTKLPGQTGEYTLGIH